MMSIKKFRRAVSPVVTTIFLFGVIIAGISVSLGIIYPQVNQLDDQIMLETAGSSLLSIDSSIQDLIVNGIDSKITSRIDVGLGGRFNYDNQILSTVRLFDGAVERTTTTINQPRLQIVQEMGTDFLEEGENTYFNGAGDQSYLFLNEGLRSQLRWSIINQSRAVNSDIATSSLSYRHIVTSSQVIMPQKLFYNLTISIQMVNITLSPTSDTSEGGDTVGVDFRFVGSTARQTNWVEFTNDLTMTVTNQFPESGTSNTIENPLNGEAPSDSETKFFVRFEFKYHQIELTI